MSERRKHAALTAQSGFGSTDLLLLWMTVIWGSNFTAIKYSLEDLLPLSFNALRFTLASAVLLVIVLRSRGGFKISPGDGKKLFALGLLGNTFYQTLFITGMAQTIKEFTLTGELKSKDGVIFRLEYRHDFSDIIFFAKNASRPSKQQNTFTGKLTAEGFDAVLRDIRRHVG